MVQARAQARDKLPPPAFTLTPTERSFAAPLDPLAGQACSSTGCTR